jgi:hypothetical protein
MAFFTANGLPFQIEVFNTDADQTDSNGFDLVYNQAPCALAVE